MILSYLAGEKSNKELYEDAIIKYTISLELNAENGLALSDLSGNLLNYSHFLTAEDKNEVYINALNKSIKAYEIDSKYSYNLSCSYAALNENEKALKYLEESLKSKVITKNHVLEDEDWKNLKEEIEFKKILNNYL